MNKKLKIMATTCLASGTRHLTETAQTGQRLHSFCLSNNVFDTNPEEELIELKKCILKDKIRALILDNCWLPGKIPGISHKQIDFARELHDSHHVETFFLCRSNDGCNNLICELWRANKPLQYSDMVEPALHTVRLGVFNFSEVFDIQTGNVYPRSGGDGGWNQVQHAVRNYRAFHERDWPKIVEVVKKELSL
jgi:hypothetical protein